MTANQMNDGQLAERMGSEATERDAATFREVLRDARLADTETADIPDWEWFGLMAKTF